jgi:hypothetical protein
VRSIFLCQEQAVNVRTLKLSFAGIPHLNVICKLSTYAPVHVFGELCTVGRVDMKTHGLQQQNVSLPCAC